MEFTELDRVDVALATYNGETYMPAFLETVAAQRHGSLRVVGSDANSRDEPSTCSRLLSQAARLSY